MAIMHDEFGSFGVPGERFLARFRVDVDLDEATKNAILAVIAESVYPKWKQDFADVLNNFGIEAKVTG